MEHHHEIGQVNGLKPRLEKLERRTAHLQHHGLARGSGEHKRHPATGHYGMGPEGNKYQKRR
jgi:hypothetical protein